MARTRPGPPPGSLFSLALAILTSVAAVGVPVHGHASYDDHDALHFEVGHHDHAPGYVQGDTWKLERGPRLAVAPVRVEVAPIADEVDVLRETPRPPPPVAVVLLAVASHAGLLKAQTAERVTLGEALERSARDGLSVRIARYAEITPIAAVDRFRERLDPWRDRLPRIGAGILVARGLLYLVCVL